MVLITLVTVVLHNYFYGAENITAWSKYVRLRYNGELNITFSLNLVGKPLQYKIQIKIQSHSEYYFGSI